MTRRQVVLTKAVHTVLRRLHPETRRSVRRALDKLRSDPERGKPLKEELEGLWSLPVARHRIIYQIEDRRIVVIFVGPRRDVYQTLRTLLTK